MAVQTTDALARTIVNAYGGAFDSGVLEIRTGVPPGPSAVPSGTLLVSISLPADAFAAASGRSILKSGTWQANAGAGGTAGHYRLKASGDTGAATQNEPREEGTVTATGGGGDLTLDNAVIANAQTVTINTFTKSM